MHGRVFLTMLAVLVAGCSVTVGGGAVSAADVEAAATEQFSQQFPVDSVECSEDLPAEEGASIVCVLESEGSEFEMTATVTGVDGSDVDYHLELTAEL